MDNQNTSANEPGHEMVANYQSPSSNLEVFKLVHIALLQFNVVEVWPSVLSVFLLLASTVGTVGLLPLIPAATCNCCFKVTSLVSSAKTLPTIILFGSSIGLFLGNELSVFVALFTRQLTLLIAVISF